MKWQVRTYPRAEADVAEARDWYDQQRPGLGREFLQVVRQALMELEQHPQRHAVYYRGIRRILTHRFPYKLFYTIQDERVEVLRVLHSRRDHRRLVR